MVVDMVVEWRVRVVWGTQNEGTMTTTHAMHTTTTVHDDSKQTTASHSDSKQVRWQA